MSNDDASQGVSLSYVFKNSLQSYTHKAGISLPVYETIQAGPSHKPTFSSSVIVNNVRYDSLPGFSTRKVAEQSAAEVALMKLAQSGEMKDHTSKPLHKTGLCKNLLQDYAMKMKLSKPIYQSQEHKNMGLYGRSMFSCTVKVGEMDYNGGFAITKKEAEIKAARQALQANLNNCHENTEGPTYTVLPKQDP